MKDRVHIYDNPVGVLTNNPPFDKQMFNLNKAPLLQMGGKQQFITRNVIIRMLVERQALEELHEVNNHQEELGGSGYSSRETPNRQTQMNKKERRKYPSLRSFTRSENLEKSEGQLLVENTVQEWYNAKHATSSVSEIEFINSLDIKQCPFCGFHDFTRYGHKKDGTQRYICKGCGKRFTALTNTIFDSKKIPISE